MSSTSSQKYANGPGNAINKQAQLASAYQELGKELSSEKLKVVGGYTIGRVIGEGSFGAVHIATHRLTGSRCAIKKIPKTRSSQITREIHHHRRLHHLHIVQLYEIIATESHIWLVTELCSGGELFDYLVERGRMLEGEARRLFGELTVAVGYMHDAGVVHRDLKLENILLDGELRVKLADLGFAREWSRGKLMDTHCGTTGYASPEMLSGKKYTGVETDVWSLGIILYILLCGGLPFDDDDERVMKDLIIKGDYEEPEWLSHEARSLIRSMLNQEPSERPTIEAIFAHPWFKMTIVDTLPGGHSMPPSPVPHHTDETKFNEGWARGKLDTLQLPPLMEDSPLSTPAIKAAPSSVPDSDNSETSFDFLDSDQARSSAVTTPTTLESETADVRRVHSGEFSHTEKELELQHSNASQSTIRRPVDSPSSISGGVLKNRLATQPEEDEELHMPKASISFEDQTLHLPVAHSSRTPSRTKRRSASSTLSLERRLSHHSTSGQYQTYIPEDYLAMLRSQRPVIFSTPSEKFLLNQLNDLGFDIGQLMHSVENDACDSSASNWWVLRAKQVERGETDDFITARQASSAKKREKLAAYAREERRKARDRGEEVKKEPSPDLKPIATVAFTDEAKLAPRVPNHGYHLAPPIITSYSSTSSDLSTVREYPTILQPLQSPSTPTKESRSLELSSPTDSSPREKAGKTRSPSLSMMQRATALLGGGDKEDGRRERSQSEDPDKRDSRSTSPTKLIKPQPTRGMSRSESDNTLAGTHPSLTPLQLPPKPPPILVQQPEAGPSRQTPLPAVVAAQAAPAHTAAGKSGKRDSMWTSWTTFRQFFDQGGQRRRRRGDGSPVRLDGKPTPTIVLSRGIAARTPHVNRINQAQSSRRPSLDGRPTLYSRRSSSVNSRRSSVTSNHLPSDFGVRVNSYDGLPHLGRRASQRSHGSQTPTSDREQNGYEFPSRSDSIGRRNHHTVRSPSMDSSGRFSIRQPASPLHNYQRRPPQGTASKRIRHIRVIPESQVLRTSSVASSIKSNPSSRASSIDGRREDSDYDTASGRDDASLRTKRRRSEDRHNDSLARQIHRKGSPLVHQQGVFKGNAHNDKPKVTLKPKAALRDVFQGKDDEWEDENEFAGGYGQGGGGVATSGGDRWMDGGRAASFPSASSSTKPEPRKKRPGQKSQQVQEEFGETAHQEKSAVGPVSGRRGIPASRGAPMPIAEEEEEEEE